jgi:hypothetical protein
MTKLKFNGNLKNLGFPSALVAIVLALTALLPLLLPGSKAQTGPLLAPTNRQVSTSAIQNPTVIRSQNVVVNIQQLKDPQLSRLTVPLFDGATVILARNRVETTREGGFLWHGKIADQPGSFVILSAVGEVLIGNIATQNGERYQIRYLGQGVHSLRQIDQSKFPDEAPPSPPSTTPSLGDRERDTCATDPPSDIDVMAVYTATTRSAAGGTNAIVAEIYLAVAETNQSYINSDIDQRLRLVHLAEVNYAESGNSTTDKNRLREPADGHMDNVHTLRDTYAADLVILVTESLNACGEAYGIMGTVGNAFESDAFCVVQRSCATGNYSFGHELAHLMGARHDWFVSQVNNQPYPYNHGFTKPTPTAPATPWRTVMAYNDACEAIGADCLRVPYYSNPNVNYPVGGDAMGVANGPEQADNHQTLNNTALTVANFRCSSPGVNDVWMKDRWNDTGLEPDPNTAGESMSRSPYIWIRNDQDAELINQHQHQNPIFGQTNWVYVKLHNGDAAAANGNLELYYAQASTGLSWPADWTLLTTIPVNGFPAHSTRIVEAQWDNLPGVGHYCMLARWNSASDPMNGEGANIGANVRNNNNLVWRNLNIIDLAEDKDTASASFIVRNPSWSTTPYSLLIRTPPSELDNSFTKLGQVFIQFDPLLLAAWQQGGSKGSGFINTPQGYLVISPNGALFENLRLPPSAIGRVNLTFKKLATTPKRRFNVDAIQFDPLKATLPSAEPAIGGVSYEIHTDVNFDK